MRDAGMPSLHQDAAIAADAAMNRSTCRYFQRENECRCRRKSTRREATSRSPAVARPERQRHRRHRHAVRVVGVDDVGPERADDAREPPGRGEIHLGARRQRHQIVALAGAPVQHAARVRDQHGPMAALAHPEHGQEDLVLSAAPGEGGVEVE